MNCDPNALAQAARCFNCQPPLMLEAVKTYLLCQWGNSQGSGAQSNFEIDWTPASIDLTPIIGLNANKAATNMAGITSLTINHTTNSEGYDFEGYPDLTSISFPNLTTLTGQGYLAIFSTTASLLTISLPNLLTVGGHVDIGQHTAMTSITIPKIISCAGFFNIDINTAMTSISLPALTTVGGDCNFNNNSSLTTLNIPVLNSVGGVLRVGDTPLTNFTWNGQTATGGIQGPRMHSLTAISFPNLVTTGDWDFHSSENLASIGSLNTIVVTNGRSWSFFQCALPSSEVNKILAKWVAAGPGITSGTIDTRFGTNGVPTGQGVTDKATLQGQGVTVLTN